MDLDKSVSPHEFKEFLFHFGPFGTSCAKVIKSLSEYPPSPTEDGICVVPWFSWTRERTVITTPGAYRVRYSTNRCFALDCCDESGKAQRVQFWNVQMHPIIRELKSKESTSPEATSNDVEFRKPTTYASFPKLNPSSNSEDHHLDSDGVMRELLKPYLPNTALDEKEDTRVVRVVLSGDLKLEKELQGHTQLKHFELDCFNKLTGLGDDSVAEIFVSGTSNG